MKCVRPTCGRKALNNGTCRGLCRPHHNEFTRRRRAELGADWFVDAAPLRRHLVALRDAGLGYGRIAALTGYHPETISNISRGKRQRTTAEVAAKILAIQVPSAVRPTLCMVPAIGTQRRLRALVAFGYSNMAIAGRLGIDNSALGRIHRQTQLTAQMAHKVDAVFRELQLVPGPNLRARRRGLRLGWPLPLAWDEDTIDDPAAEPASPVEPPAPFADRYLDARETGRSRHEIAELFGIKPDSLERQLFRHGLYQEAS